MKKIILLLVFLILSIQAVSAVDVYLFWVDNDNRADREITIEQGSSTNFYLRATGGMPFDLRIWAEENNQQIYEFENLERYEDIYFDVYEVTSDIYREPGDYEIHFYANDNYMPDNDDDEFLTLHVEEADNNSPEVIVEYPNGGEDLSGNINIVWEATDEDEDELTIDIDYSDNDGRNWHNLYENLENDGIELWNTANYPDGNQYLIKVTASDGEDTESDVSNNVFTLINNGNDEPSAHITSPQNNYIANVDSVIQFRGYGEDPNEDRIISYKWNLGNNVERDEQNFDYTYNEAGEYDITFEVKDEYGSWSNPSEIHIFISDRGINNPPYIPSNPNPANGAVNVVPRELTLSWNGGDPDGDVVRYDVYLGRRLVCENSISTFCNIEDMLRSNTGYTWNVIASDGELRSRSLLWSFTTEGGVNPNQVPIVNILSPNDFEKIDGIHNIKWNAYDNDGDITKTRIEYRKPSIFNKIFWFLIDDYSLLVNLEGNPLDYNWDTTKFPNGKYDLKIIVTDDDDAKTEDEVKNFRIYNIIEKENHAPKITSKPITEIIVNTQYKYDVDATDVDGDKISYSLIKSPEFMVINSNTGVINWKPIEVGEYEVSVKVTDGKLSDSQKFTIKVLSKKEEPKKEIREVHKFSISNIILYQDSEYVKVYVQVKNKGNQKEDIELNAIIMENGERGIDTFSLEDNDNQWRTLYLDKPLYGGVYTIGVWGNSDDHKEMLYRTIII